MYGFPLTFGSIRKNMHSGKKKFSTAQEAKRFHKRQCCYICPFCCMFHLTSHKPTPRYDQQRWWVIWNKEMESIL